MRPALPLTSIELRAADMSGLIIPPRMMIPSGSRPSFANGGKRSVKGRNSNDPTGKNPTSNNSIIPAITNLLPKALHRVAHRRVPRTKNILIQLDGAARNARLFDSVKNISPQPLLTHRPSKRGHRTRKQIALQLWLEDPRQKSKPTYSLT